MKKLFALILFFLSSTLLFSQGTWVQKADAGGGPRRFALGVSTATKGYVGFGAGGAVDIWEYNPSLNTWTQKANFPGIHRSPASGFSIGNKIYYGCGEDINGSSGPLNDFWEFNPNSNIWSQKSNCPFSGIHYSACVAAISKGYLFSGDHSPGSNPYMYEYDPLNDTWDSILFPGSARILSFGFSVDNKVYVGGGHDGFNQLSDFWCFDPNNKSWIQLPDFGGGTIYEAATFAINNQGYVCGGSTNGVVLNTVWCYDVNLGSWSQKTPLPGPPRWSAMAFEINNKGYCGTGGDASNPRQDFYKYSPCSSPTINSQISNITICSGVDTGYTLSNIAGSGSIKFQWQVSTDSGNSFSNLVGQTTNHLSLSAVSFSQNGNQYRCAVSNGCGSSLSNVSVLTIISLPAATITAIGSTIFCQGDSVVLNTNSGIGLKYQWKLNNVNISGAKSSSYIAKVAGSYRVLVTNSNGCSAKSSSIIVTVNPIPTATITPNGSTTFCGVGSVVLNSNATSSYQWFKNNVAITGETNQTFTATTSGNYTVQISTNCGLVTSSPVTVTKNPVPTILLTTSGPTTFCLGDSVIIGASSNASNPSYQWYKGGVIINGATSSSFTAKATGKYSVKVSNTLTGCTKSSTQVNVTVNCRVGNDISSSNELLIYPNPSSDIFNLSFTSETISNCCITIYSSLSEVVYNSNFESTLVENIHELNLNTLHNGIYFVQIKTDVGVYRQKLIKQ